MEMREYSGKTYQVYNGVWYHKDTPETVIKNLDYARRLNKKVRLFYGENGQDWLEENDVFGYIGHSTGIVKIPLLLETRKATGGGSILDHCIVKLQIAGVTVWQHENYEMPDFVIGEPPEVIGNTDMCQAGYTVGVYHNGENVANFKKPGQAEKWVKFMRGERGSK